MIPSKPNFRKQGEHYVWGTGAALALTLLAAFTLIVVIMVNGLGYFWPARLAHLALADGSFVMGELTEENIGPQGRRVQLKVGNRDIYGLDFKWVDGREITSLTYPDEAVTLERRENGNFYGTLSAIRVDGLGIQTGQDLFLTLQEARKLISRRMEDIDPVVKEMGRVNLEMEDIRLEIQKLRYQDAAGYAAEIQELDLLSAAKRKAFDQMNQRISDFRADLAAHTVTLADAAGTLKEVPLVQIMRAYRPNRMSLWEKSWLYIKKIGELLTGEPRESNTEGGLFPAIFGTMMMVMTMSFFSIPLGVVAAIYLSEYAKPGVLVRLVRVAVYNLAGVPSIVFGVFGLGFFIYGVGGAMDQLFFPERLPTPVFGTGGILWASLTMALMTVPVVIVSTEEAFAAIPKGIREGSYSLGATKFQTLLRILLPSATPGIITGFVLAMARAAGEVAPLMITGVVKLAPALPMDGEFPYLHLDRKFMHLGFHIYDVGFQSPNVEAAKPMVFVTTLLLLVLVVVLSLSAMVLRNRMRARYQTRAF
ncbi:MAG: phosphate ABC transporter permease PstA [Deltaproteobacteria bacterium]|nr:phosphate ABC transporter permease PstA [Deltaproteobacteria bacterium]